MCNWLIIYLIIFIFSALFSYFFTFLTRFISKRLKIVDNPGPFKIHAAPTPRLGGIGIFISFISTILLFSKSSISAQFGLSIPINNQVVSIIIGGCIIMLLGLYDDIRASTTNGISAVIKLIILFFVTIILSQGGILLNFPLPYIVNLLLTLFWIVGVISAFNAIDNMNGLASGLALIAASTYTIIALQTGQWLWGILAIILMGSNAGFLPHNFRLKKTAAIFMGDSGSFFIGFILGVLSIMGGWSKNPIKAAIIPILILGVPILDLIYVVIHRYQQKITTNISQIITYNGHDHFSHRINHFLSPRQTVLFIYLISFTLGIGAIALRNTTKWEAILIFAQYFLIFIIIILLIEFIHKSK
jgi:UDP-GlcNAc:undecaprenyl-phosphate/decaprenyl-phosphate GlcNAc-1-phosphate transferase